MKVLAIVIGNNNYYEPDELKNAVNDAKSMEDVFRRLGYSIISAYDCNTDKYAEILKKIDQDLSQYDASIFFYAGHGFQVDGENYLPSIECQINNVDKYLLNRHSLRLSELLEIYEKFKNKTHIVILDACRMRTQARGAYDSFAPISAPPGTLIAFSTSPNCAAKDSVGGDHSVYTEALLSYIGHEQLAVEDLFKKVRRAVALWTKNQQITWEHTSLITDFYFNTGQMIASLQIPYKEDVVCDSKYSDVGEIASLINDIRISDYNKQNPAIDKMLLKSAADLDRNQQFIFGRNLLQASYKSFSAQRFMNSLNQNLCKYKCDDGDNHVLNGILFEIYFDSHGEFRSNRIKDYFFNEIMSLRHNHDYAKSFGFIRTLLNQYKEGLIYLIPENNHKLDVDITVKDVDREDFLGIMQTYSEVSMIAINGKDITNIVKHKVKTQGLSFDNAIAKAACAPIDAIELHSNIPLHKNIYFDTE